VYVFQDLDDLDEDALLGGSDDEVSITGGASTSRVKYGLTSFHDEEVLQIDVNEPDDLYGYVHCGARSIDKYFLAIVQYQ